MKLAIVLAWIVLLMAGTSGLAGGSSPADEPRPAPGPIIVIRGGTGSVGIAFEVNGTPQWPGPATIGLLREDFIGQAVDFLECRNKATGAWGPAQSVSVSDSSGDAYRLVIEKTTLGTLWWTLEEKKTTPPRTIALRPSSATPGTVPMQFLELSAETMRTGENVLCSEVRFRVVILDE